MPSQSHVLDEPLCQEVVPHSAGCNPKILTLLSLFIGIGFAVVLCTGRDEQQLVTHAPAITIATRPQLPSSGYNGIRPLPLASKPAQLLTVRSETVASGLNMPNPALKGASAVVTPLLKPFYNVEAPLQAAVTGAVGGTDSEEVRADIERTIAENPCVIYSYPLSPFCTDAVKLLESTGCSFKLEEPGQEWFLLGPKGSAIRNELGKMTGQTSFPHVFIGGESVGGLFSGGASGDGIAGLAESGELVKMLEKSGACKKPQQKTGGFSFFR